MLRRASGVLAALFLTACSRAALPVTPAPTSTILATASPVSSSTPEPTVTATASAAAAPTANLGPTPDGGAAELLFGVVERVAAGYRYGPIILLHLVEGTTRTVTPGEYELLGVSPGGDRVLARRESRLVLLDLQGMETDELSDRLLTSSPPAVWLPESKLVAFLEDVEGDRLQLYDVETGERRPVAGTQSVRSLTQPSSKKDLVLLGEACEPDDACRQAWRLDLAGEELHPLAGWLLPEFSAAGDFAAYLYVDSEGRRRLALAPADGAREVRMGVPGDNILDYSWSPAGADLLVVALVRSDYSGRWFGSRQFVATGGEYSIRELPQTGTANSLGIWSPDGTDVVLTGTEPDGDGYRITLHIVDVQSGKAEPLEPGVDLTRSNYVFVSFMAWRPLLALPYQGEGR